MATTSDLITRALRKLGAVASGQPADGNQLTDGLDYLNDLLEQWSIEDLMLYYATIISHALVAGTESYTIGPTGVIVTTRPIEILKAWIRDANGLDTLIDVVSFEVYQQQVQKETTGTYPSLMAYQPNSPDGSIYVWQSPAANLTLRMLVNVQFTAITLSDIATTLTFPPGYNKAIIDNLANEMKVEYGRAEMSEELAFAATQSKMLIKRKNNRKNTLQIDPALLTRPKAYNPYSDT